MNTGNASPATELLLREDRAPRGELDFDMLAERAERSAFLPHTSAALGLSESIDASVEYRCAGKLVHDGFRHYGL